MNVVIHDLEEAQYKSLFPSSQENTLVVGGNQEIKSCIGCFGCWVKTPGQCILKDRYDTMGQILARADRVTILSRLVYGGYSHFVKNVLDRSISYLLPFFQTIHNETHHKQRYQSRFSLTVCFYGGEITSQAREVAQGLVTANCRNFYVKEHQVFFFSSVEQLSGGVKL